MTWHRPLAWAASAFTVADLLVAGLITALAPSLTHGLVLAAAVVFGVVSIAAGVAVAEQCRRSILGPLLVIPGGMTAAVLTLVLAEDAFSDPPGSDYVTVATQGAWILVYVAIALPLVFFPDGKLPTRASRWLVWVILGDATVFMVTAATAPGPFLPPDELTPHVFGTMPETLATALTVVTLVGLPVSLVGVAVLLLRRYREGDVARRRQYRLLSLGAALLPVTLLTSWTSYALFGNADAVLLIGLSLLYLAMPAAIAVAVCRPDLFDVDRVLVETITRAIVTAVLLTVFTAANLMTGLALAHRTPAVAVAVTAAVAFLLTPVFRRLQRAVDARLYPARRAAVTAIAELQRETLSGESGPERMESRLRRALGDPSLVVGYRAPADDVLVDAEGAPIATPATGKDIMMGTERIGFLSTDAAFSPSLVREIAARAAPLVESVRLRLELRRALLEAEESRARLLRVGYEERARLERDLHDGAQQRLVALGMALRLAQRRLGRGVDVSGVLDEAVAELGTAVRELRQLAHGIRPSCLDDGLVPALSQLVSSTPLPITLHVTAGELDPDLETTAYYVAAEAITNAVKHAGAHHILLDVETIDGQLYVRVSDDGCGLVAVRSGSGLAGLADRVGAHGGRLSVDGRSGVGTVVEAVLPCAS